MTKRPLHSLAVVSMAMAVLVVAGGTAEAASISLLLNSKTITGMGDGASLSTWTGEVGSAAATQAPTYIAASGINGLPGVRFDAVDDGMATSLTQTAGAYTVMTVYNYNYSAAGQYRRVLNGGAGAGTENWLVGPYQDKHMHFASGWVANPGPSATATPLVLATAVNTGIGTGTSTFFVNGTNETDNSGYKGAFGQLGLGTAGQYAEVADSDVGLVLVFDDNLTADQRVGVESVVADNFGLSGFSANKTQSAVGNGLLAGTSLASPGATTLTSFSGGDAGEGLDLTGTFAYAVDVGSDAAGYTVQGVLFDRDEDIAGVTVTSSNTLNNWSQIPEYGASTSDNALEALLHNIQYGPAVTVAADVVVGQAYQVQLLFSENHFDAAGGRNFDVTIEGELVLDDYDPVAFGHYSRGTDDKGGVLTYTFTATDDTLNIVISDTAVTADPNAILNAFTLEVVPEPATFALAVVGLLGLRRPRRA